MFAIYLYPVITDKIKPQIEHMRPGTTTVSHEFKFPGIEPTETVVLCSRYAGETHLILLYKVPLPDVP